MPLPAYLFDDEPRLLSISLAAALAGLSPRSFSRQYLATGRLERQYDVLWHDHTNPGRPFIRRRTLEDVLGRKFDPGEIWTADHKLITRRRSAKAYRRRQKRSR